MTSGFIDYCDVLIAKKPHMTEDGKQLIKKIENVCKERQLKVMVVDSELTRNKKKLNLLYLN